MLASQMLPSVSHLAGKHATSIDQTCLNLESDLLSLAKRHFHAGNFDEAMAVSLRVLMGQPASVPALLLSIEVALQTDEFDRAREIAEYTVSIAPKCALAHLSLGRAFQAKSDNIAAEASYLRAIAVDSSMHIAFCNLAFVRFVRQDYHAAIDYGRKAIALDDVSSEAYLIVGHSFFALGEFEAAHLYVSQSVLRCPNSADALVALARTLQRLRRSEEAIELYRQVIRAEPELVGAWEGLGLAQRSLGRFDDAIISFEKALELDPEAHEIQCSLVACRRATPQQGLIQPLLLRLRSPGLSIQQQVSVNFALGKQFDDYEMYEEAFSHYESANTSFKTQAANRGRVFSATGFRTQVDKIIEQFTPAFFRSHEACGLDSDAPVFVVGHPRSGTSLTEQILASHPSVHGAGELLQLSDLNGRVSRHWQAHRVIDQKSLRKHAREHLSYLQTLGGDALRVVDKLPDNVLLLGLIATIFPRARIIMCHRDIRDNVLSCFFQRFSEGLLFSNDLVDCTLRHLEVERLMSHWRKTLRMEMLDVQYEDLVGDLESQARRLVQFLGLDWNSGCLRFHETERTVNTASMWSVRQPIYKSSVGRWRNYQCHVAGLQPLLDKGDPTLFRELCDR